jgi:hypothetical protein
MTGGRRRTARRLAASGGLALLLVAGCSALAPDPSRKAGAPAGTATTAATATGSGAPAALPSLPSGPAGAPVGPVLAIAGDPGRLLVRLDPRSLRPLPGQRLALADTVGGHAWSPDGATLALGDSDEDALYLVDARRMRALGKVWLDVPNAPQWFGWLGPDRILAVVDQPLRDPDAQIGEHAVVLVDPQARRVLRRQNLHGSVQAAAFLGDRAVLLTTPPGAIGTASLAVVDGRGTVRTVPLRAVSAGFKEPDEWTSTSVAEQRQAGLAVDPAGGRAFVVAAGAPVAEVDLATLRVVYHGLSQPVSFLRRLAGWFAPAAEAKAVSGPLRQACWLGDGLLAVWGFEVRVGKDADGQPTSEDTPSGLKLVDTRRWTVRQIHPEATAVRWHGGRLLAFGVRWYEQQRPGGIGLTIYGPGDRRPSRLLGNRPVHEVHVNGDLAYAVTWGASDLQKSQVAVVDLRAGRVLTTVRGEPPYLLLGDDRASC